MNPGKPNIQLRPAGIQDLALLQHWDTQPHVWDSDPDDAWNWPEELLRYPEWREQLIAELDGRPIGFVQMIDPLLEDTHYWGEVPANLRAIDIWIGEVDELNKGYGTEMMTQALDRCFSHPEVKAVLIDPLASNTKAIRFYARMGFEFVEARRFDEDDCLVYQMRREFWVKKREFDQSSK